jgi:hypothetical protein
MSRKGDVSRLAEALFSRPEAPPADRVRWAVDDLADFLERAGARSRLVFHACRLATSWLAPLHVAALPPLARLPLERRVRALAAMERGPLGMTVLGVKRSGPRSASRS